MKWEIGAAWGKIFSRQIAKQLLCWLARQRCHSRLWLAWSRNRWWRDGIQNWHPEHSMALRQRQQSPLKCKTKERHHGDLGDVLGCFIVSTERYCVIYYIEHSNIKLTTCFDILFVWVNLIEKSRGSIILWSGCWLSCLNYFGCADTSEKYCV